MITQFDIELRTHEILNKANAMFGTNVVLSVSAIEWFAKGLFIGQACYQHGRYFIRYNMAAFQHNSADMLNDVVPHEVAHLIVYYMQRSDRVVLGGSHGFTWKRICAALGGNPSRISHAYKGASLRARVTKQYQYRTDSGREIMLGAKIHNKMQGVPNYFRKFRDSGELIAARHFTGAMKAKT